ncbi:polysaccharide pyruvyl transferase family protein [Aliivibrio fischeri]|uniref:polysaccharide pyruvyl transferase family protein n=1 Tax=Aliivibrio fischeri TaxID=668 RepID=UPI0007C4FF67|nr:polysaccharide pyruvyl transferase family protein [Aliivibrio fischeri]
MNKPYYVILTGSKNNAGDFLIKYRAKELFKGLRPDRDIIDINGWEELDDNKLEIINNSESLILMGGPALSKKMVPNVYNLPEDLSKIKVPIIMMGVGWHSTKGEWEDSKSYTLNNRTKELIEKISSSGHESSVRDYHTQNVLFNYGYKNVIMTGCPALYDLTEVNNRKPDMSRPKKIAYSLGVSFKESKKMFAQMQNILTELRSAYGNNTEIEVVFHHGLGDNYKNANGSSHGLIRTQKKYLNWLKENDYKYIDISGSAENLIKYYSNVDLHVGYRVHAHIFMNSISKNSILLNEDGRGKALKNVIGGVTFDSYTSCTHNKFISLLHKLAIPFDNYSSVKNIEVDIVNAIDYELSSGVRFKSGFQNIDAHFEKMQTFISKLP